MRVIFVRAQRQTQTAWICDGPKTMRDVDNKVRGRPISNPGTDVPGRKRDLQLELRRLREEQSVCQDKVQSKQIRNRIFSIEKSLSRRMVSATPSKSAEQQKIRPMEKLERVKVPLQKLYAKLYLAPMKAKRQAARKISGRNGIRAHFVQGGAPGGGKR